MAATLRADKVYVLLARKGNAASRMSMIFQRRTSAPFTTPTTYKHLGEPLSGGKGISTLGRVLLRYDKGIHLQGPKKGYITEMVELLGLWNGKAARPIATSTPTKKEGGATHMDNGGHRIYRRAYGTLLWLVPIRPDVSHASKEPRCPLLSSTFDDCAKLKHAIRYTMGTRDYRLTINSDLFGDYLRRSHLHRLRSGRMRYTTTGCTVTLSGVVVHHYTWTHTAVALSSGEAELYALGSGITETMGSTKVSMCMRRQGRLVRHYAYRP